MPAKSKQQQKFMGMVHAIHKGELEPSEVSPEMRKAAVSLKKKTAKDFASTKHKGLPVKVPKKKKKTEAIQPSTATGYTKDGVVQFTGSKKVALQKMKVDKKKNPSSKYQLVDTISKKVGDKIKTEGCKKMNEGEDKALKEVIRHIVRNVLNERLLLEMGREMRETVDDLYGDIKQLYKMGLINDADQKQMKKAVDSLVKVYVKVLGNKRLAGW